MRQYQHPRRKEVTEATCFWASCSDFFIHCTTSAPRGYDPGLCPQVACLACGITLVQCPLCGSGIIVFGQATRFWASVSDHFILYADFAPWEYDPELDPKGACLAWGMTLVQCPLCENGIIVAHAS